MKSKFKTPIPEHVISRAEAQTLGMTWYFTGEPCSRGHVSTRNVASFACHECVQELRSAKRGPKKVLDLTGQIFGRLTVLEKAGSANGVKWLCSCACGNKTTAKTGHLRAGAVQSCGCLARETAAKIGAVSGLLRKTHGMSRSRLDGVFDNMIKRCEDPKNHRWDRYGGRGISVCAEWRNDRSAFFAWALKNGYKQGLTIDRIDNDGNYEPSNCRFVDDFVQQNNTSRNVSFTANGETRTIAEWARALGVTYSAVQHRYDRGWSPERIVGQPFRAGKLKKVEA